MRKSRQERRELRQLKKDARSFKQKSVYAYKMNRHHLVNKCHGGGSDMHNILWIYITKHKTWHELFFNLNLDQIIELLIRVKSAKENQTINHGRR